MTRRRSVPRGKRRDGASIAALGARQGSGGRERSRPPAPSGRSYPTGHHRRLLYGPYPVYRRHGQAGALPLELLPGEFDAWRPAAEAERELPLAFASEDERSVPPEWRSRAPQAGPAALIRE